MADNRSNSRVEVPIEVSLHCDNGSVYRGNIKDISMSGVKIKITKIHDLGFCSRGLLKMRCGSDENPCVAELHGELVRLEQDTLIYKLLGTDLKNFNQLKKAILEHAADPDKVIDEIKYNPDLSLNSLYMPAMNAAIGQFVIGAVQSIFAIYLDLEVELLTQEQSQPVPDISVSGISSFNGALYGSVVLVAELGFAQDVVAGLLEIEERGSIETSMIVDGFGELTNMIAGGVQTGLSEEYENVSLIPPVVFVGTQCMYGSDKLYSVKNYFNCKLGNFSVDCLFSIV